MATLWEMFCDSFKDPIWKQVRNPLKLDIGNTVRIDCLDYRDRTFVVKEVQQYSHEIDGKEFFTVDYMLDSESMDLEGEDWVVMLRYSPREDEDENTLHDVLVLHLSHEHEYNEELVNCLNEDDEQFSMYYDDREEVFFRIQDVRNSYHAEVLAVNANNRKNKNLDDEPVRNLEYWDYWREIDDEAGQPTNEFLFIEKDTENGWFQFWRGFEISPQKIDVITR